MVSEVRAHGGVQGVYAHASAATGTDMTFAVYVPPHAPGARLPVVWYLSGLTCTHANVMEKGEYRAACAEHGLILVAPDTSPRGEGVPDDPAGAYDFGLGAGFYVDATESPWAAHYRMWSYVTEELPALIGEWFPADMARQSIMGHSMGGHLVLRGLVENAAHPDAAVLVAPMLGLKSAFGPWLGARIAGMIGSIGDGARAAWRENEKPGATETRQSLLTHDVDRYADELWWQQANPELVLGPPSWRWVIAAFASTRAVRDDPRLKTLAVPLLVLAPMADALVDARVAVAVAGQLPDARLVRFGDEAAHEVLREVDAVRNRAIAEIDLFLAARVPAA